jgi:hypothetical protein
VVFVVLHTAFVELVLSTVVQRWVAQLLEVVNTAVVLQDNAARDLAST